MQTIMEMLKPKGLCQLNGCFKHVKNKRRKYCSRECHEKSVGANIPKCNNPSCKNRVKRGRNLYCSWECYKIVNGKNAPDTCQREGCCNSLVSRKSTRKYCSQACYKLDTPNRPSKKKVRICSLPDCDNQIKRRGSARKYCSVECAVKSRKKLSTSSCPSCDKEFEPKRLRQIFCSDNCRKGKELSVKKIGGVPRRFSKVDKKWVLTSNITWENVHGKIPQGQDVWFKDNEWFNDMDINNLYLVEHKEYLQLIKKVTQPCNVTQRFSCREEKPEKQEYFDHTQLHF